MGILKRLFTTLTEGDESSYERKLNFISAICELKDKKGYEIIFTGRSGKPIKVDNVKYIEDLQFVELEVCEKFNYRVILIGTHARSPTSIMGLMNGDIDLYKFINKYFISDISPLSRDRYGERVSSAFDFYNIIEKSRIYMENYQKQSIEDFSMIYRYITDVNIPFIKSLTNSSVDSDFR